MIESQNTKPNQIKSSQWRNLIILSCTVAVAIILMTYVLSDHSSAINNATTEKSSFASPLNHVDAESTILEKTQKQLRDAEKKTDHLQEQVKQLSDNKNTDEQSAKQLREQNEQLLKRVSDIEKQLTVSNSSSQTSLMKGGQAYAGNVFPPSSSVQGNTANLGRTQAIRSDVLAQPSDITMNITPAKNPDTYVPAGTFAKAVMIGGADASAAVNAQSNPVPMLFRIIANGTLPNKKHSHLKDCVVTAAVVGDISSERGLIRLEKLSCTFPSGEVVDQSVEGTIFGTEGKNGVRGTPVWREGALLQRAFAAGALSGLSNGIAQTYTSNSISQLGTVQTVDNSKILQYGAANGVSKAMDKLADYNIQRAEQYHPVIQISAGTVVDVVFLNGFYLDGKKHQAEENSPSQLFTTASAAQSNVFSPPINDNKTLPLSPEQIARIQEKSKELGLRVNTANANG